MASGNLGRFVPVGIDLFSDFGLSKSGAIDLAECFGAFETRCLMFERRANAICVRLED
jgi:hypothetical protein